MKCTFCSENTRVLESRETENSTTVRRRRECKNCGNRFTTYEKPVLQLRVIKRDGSTEDFERSKLKRGILKACEKRPVSEEEVDELVERVTRKLRNKGGKEVESSEIGRLVMEDLKSLDKVAYIRFASVYKDFDNIKSFKDEVKTLKDEVKE
ncbi:MAG: transcriptional regulator NrdR [Candidatus Aenigmatarchaeota archaeon]